VSLDFRELKFGLVNGDYVYDSNALDSFLTERGRDPEETLEQDGVLSVILDWYIEHRHAGGAEDPFIEDLVQEARLSRGIISSQTGRA
jgi:hypothetical protein